MNFRLVPLSTMHFADAKNIEAQKPGADPLFVAALGIMGVVTLLIAVVNYVTLATARAGMRAREVAVRKVMGATRRALIGQFVGESVAVTLAAGLVAAALVEIVAPGVSAVLGEPIEVRYLGADGILLPLIGLCLVVGLAAGVYPALALSGFRPASVLASAKTPGGGRVGARVREGLAIGQFAIAIALMVCTAVIFAQIQFLRSADVGFQRDGLLIVKGLGDLQVAPQMRAILDAFRRTPGVISATASDRQPAGTSDNDGNVKLMRNPEIQPTLTYERIGSDYARTYGVTMVAGRPLDLAHGLDDKAGIDAEIIADRGLNVMLNESAVRAYGFSDPKRILGEQLQLNRTKSGKRYVGTVVGVVRDVRFDSPRLTPPGQVYMEDSHLGPLDQPSSWSAAVRVRDGTQAQVRERLESAWRSLVPGAPFDAETVQVTMKPFYDGDARRGQLFAAGAVLSATIACLGLYGLAAFNTSRRVKEIGIRKTLGASTADVLRLLVGEFLRPVLWANLIAWPVAWFAMRWWLAGFDQRIALNPAYFLAPSLAAIVVAVLTVAEQAMRVSRAEPSRALRYE
jgi:putative ABC transport system permease protein